MSVNENQDIRHGYLLKCPQKVLNPFKSKWQSRWFILFGNSEQGRVRLEYYDNEKASQLSKGKRVIPLSNCVSIKPAWNKEYQNVIEIVIQDKTFHLAANSKDEEKAWFRDLCKAVFGNANRNSIVQVINKPASELDFGYHSLDRTSIDGNTDSPRILHTVEESLHEGQDSSRDETQSIDRMAGILNDNTSVDGSHGSSEHLTKNLNSSSIASNLSSLVSFESGFDDGSSVASTITEASSFPVTVRATIASQNANMSGTYLLQVNPLNIVLIDVPTQKLVCEWPIQYLRRYGRGRTKFSFEASEKCKYGKGVYTFNTLEGDSIFHLVDMHARGISMRNQLLRKRTSMPEGFKPLGNAMKRLHHSEGRLIEKFGSDMTPNVQDAHLTDSVNDVNDLPVVGPGDSVSQIGTLRSNVSDPGRGSIEEEDRLNVRGASIGSGISIEIAQNMSHSGDELKTIEDTKSNCSPFESTYEEDPRTMPNKPVSPIQEETLAQTLASESVNKPLKTIIDTNVKNDSSGPNRTSTPNTTTDESTEKAKKPKLRRSSSLKLPSALKRSNSSGKDNSVKKSSSVKRSSSFRSRFFKSKNNSDDEKKSDKKEKLTSKSAQDLSCEPLVPPQPAPPPTTTIEQLDKQIAHDQIAKDFLAKAIEDDMNRNSENEFSESYKRDKKRRRYPVRHKSNEMVGDSPEKTKVNRLSSSFAGYDYKGQAVLTKTNSIEKESEEDEIRRLQRRTQSVMKKVELYESLKRQAEDSRNSTSYTLWRKRQSGNFPKSKELEM